MIASALAVIALLVAQAAPAQAPSYLVAPPEGRKLAWEWTEATGPVAFYWVRWRRDVEEGEDVTTWAGWGVTCHPGEKWSLEVLGLAQEDPETAGPVSLRSAPVSCELDPDLDGDGLVGGPDWIKFSRGFGTLYGLPHFLTLWRFWGWVVCDGDELLEVCPPGQRVDP